MSASRSRKRASASRTRKLLLGVIVAAVALALGAYGGWDQLEGFFDDPAQSGPGGSVRTGDVDLARQQLSELTVAEWASMRNYSRDRFSHWQRVDGGCNVRHKVLARDGEDIVLDDSTCKVLDGVWVSPFDGMKLTAPGDIDIDHIVPLANAWRTGAAEWDDDRRAAFANDLDTPQLIAVSASSNRSKGDQDPSQWQPPDRSYWCQYAHDWITVKHHWELSVTSTEKETLSDMLDTCE